MPLSLEQISDRLEIQDLLIRYTRAIDTRDYALLDTCFTTDAHVDYTSSGGVAGPYPEVRAWLEKALAPFSQMMHFIGNTTLELAGDTGHGRTYVVNPMGFPNPDGSSHVFTVYAHYVDEFVRTAEGWRIARRVEEQALLVGELPKALQIPT